MSERKQTNNQNGKGDKPRNCFSDDFKDNYDLINWQEDNKKKKVKDTDSERHTNMNRRDFIKSTTIAATIPAISLTCKYEDDEKGPEKEAALNYRVYCYERGQGEWTFSTNEQGSFAYQREYMTLEDEKESVYHGFMEGGKLHFANLEEAQNFIEHHYQQKIAILL